MGANSPGSRFAKLAQKRLDNLTSSRVTRATPEQIAAWRYDPVDFARQVCGIEAWELQATIMMAVATEHRVAVKSGHKVGKSLLVALLALWWVVCWPDGKVLITAPTGFQVKDIVWSEIRRMTMRANQIGLVTIPEAPIDPSTGIRWPDGRCILGRSTDKPERIQGYSGPANLYLVDEASGVAPGIFEALRGNTAGGAKDDESAVAKFLLTGNPTLPTGTFYECWHRNAETWRCFTASCFDTPNARAGRIITPGLATLDYINETGQEYGVESDMYRVRVLGLFPQQGANSVVSVHDVTQAHLRWTMADKSKEGAPGPLRIGVDVARFGDDRSCICAVRGGVALKFDLVHGMDTVEVAEKAIQVIRELRRDGERPVVKVDTIGVGGGVADILRRSAECEVRDVNVSEVADEPSKYPRLRDEGWFRVGEWMKTGAIPDDHILDGELGAPSYKIDANSRRAVEPKDVTKKKLGRSPDMADALMLALLEGRLPPKPNYGQSPVLSF